MCVVCVYVSEEESECKEVVGESRGSPGELIVSLDKQMNQNKSFGEDRCT